MENIAKDSQIDYSAAFTRSENHKRCSGLLSVYTVRHKKLHHFVFAITLSYLSLFEYLLVHIYRDKFGTN